MIDYGHLVESLLFMIHFHLKISFDVFAVLL